MKILFVCTSNIMRSPYCEFVFNRMTGDDPLLAEKVEWARSAALRWRYRHMHRQAKIALVHEGFSQEEVDSYRPRHVLIDRELFEQADVIIGMTKCCRAAIEISFLLSPRRLRASTESSATRIGRDYLKTSTRREWQKYPII